MTYLYVWEGGAIEQGNKPPSPEDFDYMSDGALRIFAITGDVREIVVGGALEDVPELERASDEPAQKKLTLIVLCKSELFFMGAEGESVMPSKYPSSVAEAKRMAQFYGVEWCEQ